MTAPHSERELTSSRQPPTALQGHSQEAGEFKANSRLFLAFTGLLVMTLMSALDSTTISVALPTIASSLHGSAIAAFWTGTSFVLTSSIFQPIFSSFSYIFGRRPLIFISLVFFGGGAMAAALAKSFPILLFGRSLQGIGGAGLIAMTEVVLTDLVPLRLRGAYTGILGSAYAIGGASGPIIGGALAQTNWRWIFWINLPFIGIGIPLIFWFLPLGFKQKSLGDKLRKIDFIGMTIFLGSTTAVLIPISWGGVQYPWSSSETIVPLVVGVFGILAFVVYERSLAEEPLIPLCIFANRSANLGFVSSMLQGVLLYAIVYYIPLYLEGIHGYSSVMTGVAMLPATLAIAPFAVATGVMINTLKGYRWSIWLGWVITTLGLGLLMLLSTHTSITAFLFILLVVGIGLGILSPAIQFQCQASQENQTTVGYAITMYSFFRAAGQTFGIAIGGVVFQNQLISRLKAALQSSSGAEEYGRDATSLVQVMRAMPAGTDKSILQSAFVDGLRAVWLFCTIIGAIGVVINLWVKEYDIDRDLETDQGLV